MEIHGNKGFAGKILPNKNLDGISWGWTGVLAGRWVKNRERNMTHHRSNYLSFMSRANTGSFDSLRSLRISAAGSDARKAPQDAGTVRLPTQGTTVLPHPSTGSVRARGGNTKRVSHRSA